MLLSVFVASSLNVAREQFVAVALAGSGCGDDTGRSGAGRRSIKASPCGGPTLELRGTTGAMDGGVAEVIMRWWLQSWLGAVRILRIDTHSCFCAVVDGVGVRVRRLSSKASTAHSAPPTLPPLLLLLSNAFAGLRALAKTFGLT